MKTLRNLAFALMALAAFACSKPETPENNNTQDDPKDEPAVEVTPVSMTFAATLEASADVDAAGVMSKVTFNGTNKSLWEADDEICVYDGEEVRLFEAGEAGESTEILLMELSLHQSRLLRPLLRIRLIRRLLLQ